MRKTAIASWTGGTLTALAGVFFVRVLALHVDPALARTVGVTGYLLALLGLFIITLGTGRRARSHRPSADADRLPG